MCTNPGEDITQEKSVTPATCIVNENKGNPHEKG